jgi:hypothetical protein
MKSIPEDFLYKEEDMETKHEAEIRHSIHSTSALLNVCLFLFRNQLSKSLNGWL